MGYLDYKLRQSHESENGQEQLFLYRKPLTMLDMWWNLKMTLNNLNNPTFIVVNIILIEIL